MPPYPAGRHLLSDLPVGGVKSRRREVPSGIRGGVHRLNPEDTFAFPLEF